MLLAHHGGSQQRADPACMQLAGMAAGSAASHRGSSTRTREGAAADGGGRQESRIGQEIDTFEGGWTKNRHFWQR
jgi:hypothetical protein